MDNHARGPISVAHSASNRTAMTMMLVIFGGSLIGGAVLLTTFFELTRL
ncbi:hypothetical protein [Sphingomonas sp. MMS24-J13]